MTTSLPQDSAKYCFLQHSHTIYARRYAFSVFFQNCELKLAYFDPRSPVLCISIHLHFHFPIQNN